MHKLGKIPTEKVVETLNVLQCGKGAEEAVRQGVPGNAAEIDKAWRRTVN